MPVLASPLLLGTVPASSRGWLSFCGARDGGRPHLLLLVSVSRCVPVEPQPREDRELGTFSMGPPAWGERLAGYLLVWGVL